ncbi:hypothetical protein DID80_05400 [Candidatus Marinamargulisbacteria bacterium SCGC AAA071-K20]|nr:hypothetical protein DID80_05400 [Candidatus Marinamargulisbacteria bacterium SCGC AAA071-K20]
MSNKQEKQKPKQQITLSRRVAIKAIVTEKFKQYLHFELEQAVKMSNQRMKEIDDKLVGLDKAHPNFKLFTDDKLRLQDELNATKSQEATIGTLKDGEMFSQGTIEGFVAVGVGDNLYDKLGGLEMIVKDGLIQKIQAAKFN